jgi:hypothetical protein
MTLIVLLTSRGVLVSMRVTDTILKFVVDLFIVQPGNCFMLVLFRLAGDVDSVVPVVNPGIPEARDLARRWLIPCLTAALAGFHLLLLFSSSGWRPIGPVNSLIAYSCVVLIYIFLVLLYVHGEGAWKTARLWVAGQRSTRRERGGGILPLAAEAGHELETVE